MFKSDKGNVANPFLIAFGALLIQQMYDYPDEETVQQIQENPYLQFFVGLQDYQNTALFEPFSMVHFRKRLTKELLMPINEIILTAHEVEKDDESTDDDDESDEVSNQGTLMLDATCARSHIKDPQDDRIHR